MAIIYSLKVGNEEYIGNTCDLKRRLREHKAKAKQGINSKIYKAIRNNNYEFEYDEIEVCPDRLARKMEQFWIYKRKPSLNTNSAYGWDMDKRRATIQAFRAKKNYCEVCDVWISAPNWAKHYTCEKHKKLISKQNVYDSLDGLSQELCEEEQDELCGSDEEPSSESSIQQK
jgi:hypothetical protein